MSSQNGYAWISLQDLFGIPERNQQLKAYM